MATGVERRINLCDVSAAVRARRRSRLLHAVVAVPAIIAALAFVDVLPPGTSEIAVASASVETLDSAHDGPMPPPVPVPPPLPPGPLAQDFAAAMQALQNLAGNGDDVTPSDDDDDFDTSQAQEQQQEEQQQQDQFDQTQNQLNTNELNQDQADSDSEQQTQEQNDESQQQVDNSEQQAQQTEIDAGQ
jgi:type IV secretory pathway VirB10-like protein